MYIWAQTGEGGARVGMPRLLVAAAAAVVGCAGALSVFVWRRRQNEGQKKVVVDGESVVSVSAGGIPVFDAVELPEAAALHRIFHEESGCLIVRGAFSKETMDAINVWTERTVVECEGDGNFRHPKQKDKRMVNDLMERLSVDDPDLLAELLLNKPLTYVWDALLGFGKIGAATVHWIDPGGARQTSHVDYPCHVQSGPCWRDDPGMLQRYFTPYQIDKVLPYFSVQTVVACDTMSQANGSTECIPGSHLTSHLDVKILDKQFQRKIEPLFQNITLAQGDLFFFNRRLAHRGGHNKSATRRNAVIFQNVWLFGVGQHATDADNILTRLERTKRVKALSDEERHDLAWRLRSPYPLDTRQTT